VNTSGVSTEVETKIRQAMRDSHRNLVEELRRAEKKAFRRAII
jgi:hypothetical protein